MASVSSAGAYFYRAKFESKVAAFFGFQWGVKGKKHFSPVEREKTLGFGVG